MGAKGNTTVDFGAHPGAIDTTVTVTGQTSITSESLAEAWLFPNGGTADHSNDEHLVDGPLVMVSDIIPGSGFTIRAYARNGPLTGQWGVGWVWD